MQFVHINKDAGRLSIFLHGKAFFPFRRNGPSADTTEFRGQSKRVALVD